MPTADNEKTERITIRCTIEQRETWERACAADRRNLADWIRIQLDDAANRVVRGEFEDQSRTKRRRT